MKTRNAAKGRGEEKLESTEAQSRFQARERERQGSVGEIGKFVPPAKAKSAHVPSGPQWDPWPGLPVENGNSRFTVYTAQVRYRREPSSIFPCNRQWCDASLVELGEGNKDQSRPPSSPGQSFITLPNFPLEKMSPTPPLPHCLFTVYTGHGYLLYIPT